MKIITLVLPLILLFSNVDASPILVHTINLGGNSGSSISVSIRRGGFDSNEAARRRRIDALESKEKERLEKTRIADKKRYEAEYKKLEKKSGRDAAEAWRLKKEAEVRKAEASKHQDKIDSHFTFKTKNDSRNLEQWINLRAAREKQINATEWLTNQPSNLPFKKERETLIGMADLLIEAADYEYVEKNIQNGDRLVNLANQALDTVMDFLPGVSLVKDVISLITGVNPITGENLGKLEKSIILGSIFLPSVLTGFTKGISKTAAILSKIIKNSPLRAKNAKALLPLINESDKLLASIFKNSQEARGFLPKVGELSDKIIDSAKLLGAKTAESINDFSLTISDLFANEAGAIGKLEGKIKNTAALTNKMKLAAKPLEHMKNPHRAVPAEILALAIKHGKKIPDPQRTEGAHMYLVKMFKNGKEYNLEVLYKESEKMILHFKYSN